MNNELISKTEKFLKNTFTESEYLKNYPNELSYRLEHSYRVANIGKQIAEAEGFDVTAMIIACLLHDVSYRDKMKTIEERLNHGRSAAHIARPFLKNLGLSEAQMNDILYGIAIHVDDKADFEWTRTPFADTVSDADNIDRFDAYRIYETLEFKKFSKMPIDEKKQLTKDMLDKLMRFRNMKLATNTATALWKERMNFYIDFYKKLDSQLINSEGLI